MGCQEENKRAYDVLLASGQGRAAAWAQKYYEHATASFSLQLYGETAAQFLGYEWCLRRDFFFMMWDSQQEDDYVYTKADYESYPESLEFITWLCSVDTEGPVWERAMAIRQEVPVLR